MGNRVGNVQYFVKLLNLYVLLIVCINNSCEHDRVCYHSTDQIIAASSSSYSTKHNVECIHNIPVNKLRYPRYCIQDINYNLYKTVNEMKYARALRYQLFFLKEYIR